MHLFKLHSAWKQPRGEEPRHKQPTYNQLGGGAMTQTIQTRHFAALPLTQQTRNDRRKTHKTALAGDYRLQFRHWAHDSSQAGEVWPSDTNPL